VEVRANLFSLDKLRKSGQVSSLIVTFSMLVQTVFAFPGASDRMLENFESVLWRAGADTYLTRVSAFDGSGHAMRVQFKSTSRLIPPRPIHLPAQSIALKLKVFGSGRKDRLFVILKDAYGTDHSILIGNTDFKISKEMSIPLAGLTQAVHLEEKGLELRWFLIVPASDKPASIQMDDLTVQTRDLIRIPPLAGSAQ
jgi:hypothetical protein